jgi:hypothetical protein
MGSASTTYNCPDPELVKIVESHVDEQQEVSKYLNAVGWWQVHIVAMTKWSDLRFGVAATISPLEQSICPLQSTLSAVQT